MLWQGLVKELITDKTTSTIIKKTIGENMGPMGIHVYLIIEKNEM